MGGLFTVYTFFTQPGLFQAYIAATPALEWDNEVIYEAAKRYAENNHRPPARLYLCVGAVERGVPIYEKFVQYLTSRRYENLRLKSQVLANTGHSGTKGIGYGKGLQFVFKRPDIQLTEARLKQIAGRYKTTDGTAVEINAASNGVILQLSVDTDEFIVALSVADQNELYSKAEFLKLHFNQDDKGTITGFDLEEFSSSRAFIKIK